VSRVPVAGDYLMDRQRAEELLGDLRRSGEVFIVGMVEMWRGQGWLALGYSSWNAWREGRSLQRTQMLREGKVIRFEYVA